MPGGRTTRSWLTGAIGHRERHSTIASALGRDRNLAVSGGVEEVDLGNEMVGLLLTNVGLCLGGRAFVADLSLESHRRQL